MDDKSFAISIADHFALQGATEFDFVLKRIFVYSGIHGLRKLCYVLQKVPVLIVHFTTIMTNVCFWVRSREYNISKQLQAYMMH